MRSFRSHLAIRASAGAALSLIAISAITAWTLRSLLDRELDASILNIASIQAASLADGPAGSMHFHEWDLTPQEADSVRDLIQFAQVWDAEGQSLLRSQYMTSDLPVDAAHLQRASSGDLTWARQDFLGTPVRSLFYPLGRLGVEHEAHVLQVAAPLTRRNEMLRRAVVFLGALTCLLVGASYAGSWWLSGRVVRPIHEVIDQAEVVRAGSLDQPIRSYADTFEYRRLVDSLNMMLARLHNAFEVQRRFTADASHELRSPLTAIRGEIEVALRQPREADEYVEVLQSTLEEAERLSKLSDALLTLARSDSGALQPVVQPVNVAEQLEGVLNRIGGSITEKQLRLAVQQDHQVVVQADPSALQQVLWNLLDNALKFTPASGLISVNVARRGGYGEIVVADSGPGFGDVDPESYFDRFARGDLVRTPQGHETGVGLGLAIVRALVRSMGGEIVAENQPERGARFTLRLPLAQSGN